jgi:hypothetical protein
LKATDLLWCLHTCSFSWTFVGVTYCSGYFTAEVTRWKESYTKASHCEKRSVWTSILRPYWVKDIAYILVLYSNGGASEMCFLPANLLSVIVFENSETDVT